MGGNQELEKSGAGSAPARRAHLMALTHITLATRDVARASAFFAEALGWRPIARPGNIGRPAAWLAVAPGVARGAALIDPIRDTPFRRFFFRDPDGYVFEVVEEGRDEPRPVG